MVISALARSVYKRVGYKDIVRRILATKIRISNAPNYSGVVESGRVECKVPHESNQNIN